MSTYDEWLGRTETQTDVATAAPAHLLAATLDRQEIDFADRDVLPPAWHWLYFLRGVRTSDLGADGHPPKGGLLPAVPLPRRMRAGGSFEFHRPLRIGERIERRSTIEEISEKGGASGPLVFVKVRYEVFASGELAIMEGEDIVYREAATRGMAAPVLHDVGSPPGASVFATNPVLLFRVSALTFNSHRIHYDTEYAKEEELYPGRVVHGPLLALLMLEHLRQSRDPATLRSSRYRAVAPTFCGERVTVTDAEPKHGTLRVVARNGAGQEAVQGEALYDQ